MSIAAENKTKAMKNWITIVEDDDTTITAHFPVARVKSVVEAKNLFAIHLDKGSIQVKGSGVEKLVKTLLSNAKYEIQGVKRLKIYQALMDFIGTVISFPEMKAEDVKKFDVARSESAFLFGKDIPQYLQTVRNQAAAITMLNSQIQELMFSERSPDRTNLVNQKLKIIDWFYKQIEVAQEKFSRYLAFES